MNINEVMIGSIVLTPNDTYATVWDIKTQDDAINGYAAADIKGVPLTPDVLVGMCGFTKNALRDDWFTLLDTAVKINNGCFTVWRYLFVGTGNMWVAVSIPEYLHELQMQILCLTGKELEVKL